MTDNWIILDDFTDDNNYIWKRKLLVRNGVNIGIVRELFPEDNKFDETDGETTASDTTFTSVNGNFQTRKIVAGDFIILTSGDDARTFEINSVTSETELELKSAPTSTASSLSYTLQKNCSGQVYPEEQIAIERQEYGV